MSQFEKLQKAAALKYSDEAPESAPVVIAAGAGETAKRIIDLAERNGVPVFRDDSLATLLSQMRSGTKIPPELYRAVVDIYVYFLGYTADAGGNVTHKQPLPAAAPPEAQEAPEEAAEAGDNGAEEAEAAEPSGEGSVPHGEA